MGKYVVVADAAVIKTGVKGNGKPQTSRVLRGSVITVNDTENEAFQSLLSTGALKEAKSAEEVAELRTLKHRLTARKAALAFGAEDEVQPPSEEHVPLDAPVPDTKPPVAEAEAKPKAKRAKAAADA